MRPGVRQVQKEGLSLILANKVKCLFGHFAYRIVFAFKLFKNRVGRVNGYVLMHPERMITQGISAAILPKMGRIKIVRLFLAQVTIVVIEALAVRVACGSIYSKPPLTNHPGNISCIFH